MKKRWHLTYYYLATGMEGRADTKDYGYFYTNTREEAIEECAKYYQNGSNWGLSAKEVGW